MSGLGQDGSACCFEIADSSGQILMELPFSEVFKTAPRIRPLPFRTAPHTRAAETKARSIALASEIASIVTIAQQTIRQTHLVLQRARPQPGSGG